MKWIFNNLQTPEANLACDEALFLECENSDGPEVLRFWRPDSYFVVLGCGQKVSSEVDCDLCKKYNIRILRRCTGGGAVLQGPGCLNYAIILKIKSYNEFSSITRTNQFIMKKHASAISKLLNKNIEVKGITDLVVDNKKISGNAQRRGKNAILFHGSFLLDLDLNLMQKILKQPPRAPDYRENRSHIDFVTNINISSNSIMNALMKTWNAREKLCKLPESIIDDLILTKYSKDEWNFKYK